MVRSVTLIYGLTFVIKLRASYTFYKMDIKLNTFLSLEMFSDWDLGSFWQFDVVKSQSSQLVFLNLL